jgi:uncharacterized protein with GYD domain
VNLARRCSLRHGSGNEGVRDDVVHEIEEAVQTYIVLANWTEQGIRAYPETVRRTEAFGGMVEQVGGRLVSSYWTVGPYDLMAVVEVPDAESLSSVLLRVGALGNVRSTTLRAFGAAEMASIVAKTGTS